MFDRIARSWMLLKATIAILSDNAKLLIFPAMNVIFITGILLFFVAPVVLVGTGYALTSEQHWTALGHKLFEYGPGKNGQLEPVALQAQWYAYVVLLYIPCMFCATFLNVAMYSQILAAFRGEVVSIRNGLRFAAQRSWTILGWSLFAGAIGYLIRALEERVGFVGRLLVSLIGVAWSVASVFAIPVIVCQAETKSPFSILKESAGTLRKTWGETLAGYVGLSGLNLLVIFGGLGVVGVSVVLALALNQFWIIIATGVLFLILFLSYSYVVSVAQQVFICALYLYASEGTVAAPYSQEMFDQAWKTKN